MYAHIHLYTHPYWVQTLIITKHFESNAQVNERVVRALWWRDCSRRRCSKAVTAARLSTSRSRTAYCSQHSRARSLPSARHSLPTDFSPKPLEPFRSAWTLIIRIRFEFRTRSFWLRVLYWLLWRIGSSYSYSLHYSYYSVTLLNLFACFFLLSLLFMHLSFRIIIISTFLVFFHW